nr:peptidyl-tRNA hydrolase Pth2 [Nanobdella aerobiophila]
MIVVRKDLDIGKGKLCTQVAHAAVEATLEKFIIDREVVDLWRSEGAKKVVLYVKDLNELLEVYKKAKECNINTVMIQDAGLTQIEPGTITCIGIGPDLEEKIDKITGTLKLL